MAIDDRGVALMGASGRAVRRGGRLLAGWCRRDQERDGIDVWPVLLSPIENLAIGRNRGKFPSMSLTVRQIVLLW
ncbi:hypothetical protein [Amycolatopsis sp. lyj-112]|uniref:hypothetical protein n=1 Tax=Amycolatopsis sp. lyj-112 TaxID=2789288 RepID=UPI0039789615